MILLAIFLPLQTVAKLQRDIKAFPELRILSAWWFGSVNKLSTERAKMLGQFYRVFSCLHCFDRATWHDSCPFARRSELNIWKFVNNTNHLSQINPRGQGSFDNEHSLHTEAVMDPLMEIYQPFFFFFFFFFSWIQQSIWLEKAATKED